jgi:hypothetical protein
MSWLLLIADVFLLLPITPPLKILLWKVLPDDHHLCSHPFVFYVSSISSFSLVVIWAVQGTRCWTCLQFPFYPLLLCRLPSRDGSALCYVYYSDCWILISVAKSSIYTNTAQQHSCGAADTSAHSFDSHSFSHFGVNFSVEELIWGLVKWERQVLQRDMVGKQTWKMKTV